MGILAGAGGAVGQSFAGAGGAGAAAQRSLGWGALSAGADVTSQLLQGIAGFQQGRYAAKVAGSNAEAALLAGQGQESIVKARTTRMVAEQKAAQAANGIDVGSKTAQAVRTATENVGAMDAAMIHYNAMREVLGAEQERVLAKKAALGALSRGMAGANASFLGGAQSLADKWMLYKRIGAV